MTRRLLSMLWWVVVSLGVAELGLRVVWMKQLFIPAGIADSHFHHRLKPNQDYHFQSEEFDVVIPTNRFGLRGPDPEMPKPAGVTRLLMLGDSFTFGFPVRDGETFSDLIEQRLNARGMRVEVINGGVSGYSPTLHYVSLRDQFLGFEPDAVMLWLDFGDLQEDAWFQKNLVYDEQGNILRCDPQYTNGRFDWWELAKNRSALAKWANNKIVRTWDKLRMLGVRGYLGAWMRGERAKVAIARLKASQRSPDVAESDQFVLVRDSATVDFLRPQWALTGRYLVMSRDLLAERGIPLMLGVYPYGMLAGPDQWAEGRTAWGFEKGRLYEARAAIELLREFSRTEHMPLVNTIDHFKEAAKAEKLFYDWDGHLTPAGHRVLADDVVNNPLVLSMLRAAAGKGER